MSGISQKLMSSSGGPSSLLAVGGSSLSIYRQQGDTFTKLPDPAVLPSPSGGVPVFSSDDTYLAVGQGNSPYIIIYKRSGETFTKLPDPASLPSSGVSGVAFSSDDTYMAVTFTLSPFIAIYKRSGDTFTKLPTPAYVPTQQGTAVAFSPDDTYLAVGNGYGGFEGEGLPFIQVYKRSGDTFTKLADPAVLPTNYTSSVTFSNDSIYMPVGTVNTPFLILYKRSGDTFTKLANPAVLPGLLSAEWRSQVTTFI
jgi:WD40 repeat protein